MAKAKITAELGLKVGNVSGAINAMAARVKRGLSPLANVQAGINRLRNAFAPLAAAGAAVAGGIAAVGAVAGALGLGAKRAMDLGGELTDLAARTGAPIRELVILQQAFKNTGLSAQQVGPALSRLQRALSTQAPPQAREALEMLGLSAESLRDRLPTEQLQVVGRAISNLADPAERAGVAMSIFGREGAALMALFDDSSAIETAATQLGNQAQIFADNAALFDRISDSLNAAFLKVQGFFVGLASEVAPVLLDVTDSLNRLDLSSLGQQIGRAIAILVEAFRDGSLWKIVGDSLIIGFSNAINFLFRELVGVLGAFGQILWNSLDAIGEILKPLTTPEFWRGLIATLQAAAFGFVKILSDGLLSAVEYLRPVLDKVGMGGVLKSLQQGAQRVSEFYGQRASSAWAAASETTQSLRAGFGDRVMGALLDGVQNAYNTATGVVGDVFDTSGLSRSLEQTIGSLNEKIEQLGEAARASESVRRSGRILSEEELDAIANKQGQERSPGRGPVAERLMSLGGAINGGLFVKNILARDPLLTENQKQTRLLAEIVRKLGQPQSHTFRIDPKLVRFA